MAESTIVSILTGVLFLLPLIGALWRIFRIKEELQDQIQKLEHRLALLSAEQEHMSDRQELGFNGFRERIEHTASRLRQDTDRSNQRIDQVENFLAKTTAYEKRDRP